MRSFVGRTNHCRKRTEINGKVGSSDHSYVRGDVSGWTIVAGRRDMTPDADQEAENQLDLRYRLAATDAYFEAGSSVIIQEVVPGR